MKYIILIGIRFYWFLPQQWRKKCLYRETCSNFVYRQTKEYGFRQGVNALRRRIDTCKPRYKLIDIDNQRILILCNGETIGKEQMAKWLLK